MPPELNQILWPANVPAHPRIILASSGGIDSLGALVWLHAQWQLGKISALSVVSINHQIHADSAAWSATAVQQAAHFGLHAEVIIVDLPHRCPQGHRSLEARARAARYTALRNYLAQAQAGTVLITAHHQADQAETLLLAALRASSLAGLAAMPVLAAFGTGWHWRPLLHTPAESVHALARTAALSYVDDPSNWDTDFDRNYLRHEIMPRLQARFPQAIENLSKTAEHAARDWAMLTELARQDSGSAEWGDTIALAAMQSLSAARQANLIRGWIKAKGAPMPPKAKLDEFIRQCETARTAQRPALRWDGWAITRYRQHLYWRNLALESPFEPTLWRDKTQACQLNTNIKLTLTPAEPNDPLAIADNWLAHPWCIRMPAPKDRLKPTPQHATRDLKHWFSENNIPPWLRGSVIMVDINQQLMGAVGLITHDAFQAKTKTGWRIAIEQRAAL